MAIRISSRDTAYQAGDLSVLTLTTDTKDTLYVVRNNAATTLVQTLPINGIYMIVNDATGFPPTGLLRIGPNGAVIPGIITTSDLSNSGVPGAPGDAEMIYYGAIVNNNTFTQLQRVFAGSRQNQWSTGTPVTNSVMAEPHNTLKDAIINMEKYIGKQDTPAAGSLNYQLNALEDQWFSPQALFRAYPTRGRPTLTVNFKHLCSFNVEKLFWDFGDGSTYSSNRSETVVHQYTKEGAYTVTLNIITNTNAQGITIKSNYIMVANDATPVYFYAVPDTDNPNLYHFVDQTEGPILERIWVLGDGTTKTITDPNIHTFDYTYLSAGTYSPSLLVTLSNQATQRGYLSQTITIS